MRKNCIVLQKEIRFNIDSTLIQHSTFNNYAPSTHLPVMKGKSISEDLAWTIIRMAPLVALDEIEAYTSVSKAQIKRILARWRATGSVKAPKDSETCGRPRHLTPEDVNVCFSLPFCCDVT